MSTVGRAEKKRHHMGIHTDIPGASPHAAIRDSVHFDDGASLTDVREEQPAVLGTVEGKPVWIEK